MSEVNSREAQIEQLKKELFELEGKRKKIEDELVMHKVVLENNRVGMNDSLTDKDDFPRNDIDVYAVRHARAAINRLEFDAKDIFNQMQSRLEELHALSK
jgi:26S proteasome non-ATPase regulatory subunit 9